MIVAKTKTYDKHIEAQDYLTKNLNMQGSKSIKSQAKKFWNGLTHIIHERNEQKEVINNSWNSNKGKGL